MTDVVVIGGGIAGLATAYELSRRSVPFVLLESGPRLGGVVLSEQFDGYTLDAGPDALLVHKPDGIKLCEELGLGDRLVPTKTPRTAFVQRNGRLFPLPDLSVMGIPTRIGPFVRSRLFTWAGKARMGAELFVRPRRDESDESIGAFMTRRFGVEAATYLAEPLLAGIHAGDVHRLSAQALFPRFVAAERTHGSLLRAFRIGQKAEDSNQGAFRSLPGGLSELIHAVSAALPASSIRLSAGAVKLSPPSGGSGYAIETASGQTLRARSVVLAAPAFVTARLVQTIDRRLSDLCGAIPYASTATVSLAFPRSAVAHPLNGSGFVVPKVEHTGILAGSWMSSKWPNRAPDDRVLLRAFIGGARDPRALDRSDSELVAVALNTLTPLLGIGGAPLLARVYRLERAVAQHEVGHLARLSEIEQRVANAPGLFITGSGFRASGIPHCISEGRAIAARAAAWLTSETLCAQEGRR